MATTLFSKVAMAATLSACLALGYKSCTAPKEPRKEVSRTPVSQLEQVFITSEGKVWGWNYGASNKVQRFNFGYDNPAADPAAQVFCDLPADSNITFSTATYDDSWKSVYTEIHAPTNYRFQAMSETTRSGKMNVEVDNAELGAK